MQAALLAGLSCEGLFQVEVPHGAPWIVKLLYLLFALASLSLEIIAVLNTTLLAMMGPGLALRGPAEQACVHRAVEGMREEYQSAYICFVLGLVFLIISLGLYGWVMMFDCAPQQSGPS